jgi:predicted CXXCH cytochrome family protein
VRRLVLLTAVGALWLFLAALPALADGGPHVSSINNGSLGINADGCAGCHRAHTAQGPYLINAADEEALCLTCHGAASTGSTVDVMTGVQYVPAANGTRTGTQLGATRNGGFDQARIGASEVYRLTNATASIRTKIPPAAPEPVTSAHLALPENGLTLPGIAWGNGDNGSGIGPAVVDLSCGSCHNPHGNGQFRILNPIPETASGIIDDAWVNDVVEVGVDGTIPDLGANVYRTAQSHGLLVGDTVTVAGNSSAAANVANATVATLVGTNGFTLTGVTTGNGTGGTVTRIGGVKVTDAALPPAGDTRNYTVIQTVATAPTLLASQAAVYPPSAGDYLHRGVPWFERTNQDAPNGLPATFDDQISAWCSSCHTRYLANQNPTSNPADTDGVDNSWRTPRAGDDIYMYQHRVRSDRACTTCHVSHGSNAVMSGTFSSTYTYPDGTVSASSRLLKADNRGTCQSCHDPTGTFPADTSVGPVPVPLNP